MGLLINVRCGIVGDMVMFLDIFLNFLDKFEFLEYFLMLIVTYWGRGLNCHLFVSAPGEYEPITALKYKQTKKIVLLVTIPQ